MMDKINENQAEALAVLIHTLRPDWDTPGVKHALRRAIDRGDQWELAHAALRAAAEPGNRTPAVIGYDGKHWRPDTPTAKAPPHPDPYQRTIRRDNQTEINQHGMANLRKALAEWQEKEETR